MNRAHSIIFALALFGLTPAFAEPLAGTQPLTIEGDLSAQMVAGIGRYLDREIAKAATVRLEKWEARIAKDDETVRETDAEAMRKLLRQRLGMVDESFDSSFDVLQSPTIWPWPESLTAANKAATYRALRVRWRVFDNVWGDGLLLQQSAEPKAIVIALPDADQDPTQIATLSPDVPDQLRFAYRLVQQGCTVLVPLLIDRETDSSGSEIMDVHTNEPHREWIYRQAFEVGRTLTGYEVQMVLTALDGLQTEIGLPKFRPSAKDARPKIGVIGYGEGGLIALHAAALDSRIDATLVSGHFGPHDQLWQEPIYRNVFAYQRDFGDAELAALIAPRPVVVEHAIAPNFTSPPKAERNQRSCAAPGAIKTPPLAAVESEVARAKRLHASVSLIKGSNGEALAPISDAALLAFLQTLGFPANYEINRKSPGEPAEWEPRNESRFQYLAFQQLEAHTQGVLGRCEFTRNAQDLWKKIKPGDEWKAVQKEARRHFDEDVIGKLPADFLPPNPRSRVVLEKEKWIGYDMMLDVLPDVFAWGVLLLPKDLKPGERRPVVVCQHGLEGVPMDTITDDETSKAYAPYKAFAARLAERGFIVYAPHNPYRGQDELPRAPAQGATRSGCRCSRSSSRSTKSSRDWLASLPFVDPQRIAFYGLSYGGKTRDAHSRRASSATAFRFARPTSTSGCARTPRLEYPVQLHVHRRIRDLRVGPRPHLQLRRDGAAHRAAAVHGRARPRRRRRHDEWVGYEFAKVRNGYNKLGIRDRTEIEWFDGPHTINGVGTFKFLHKHLNWSEPK